jgi:uncharacterized protein (TIGR04255 family)
MTARALRTEPSTRPRVRPRYKNPPIIEAILNIQVDPPVEGATLANVVPAEPIRYTSKETLSTAGFTIDVANGIQSSLREEIAGYRYLNESGTQAVQVRRDGFAFTQLVPYPTNGWDDWRQEAERLWKAYLAVANPRTVVRLQVRYANRIRIPGTRMEPGEYFNTYLAIAPGLPDCNHFLLRAEFSYDNMPGARLQITQGPILDFPQEDDVIPILLDLDVSRSIVMDPTDPALWERLEELHECETDAFEACITNKSRELFN